MSPDGPGGLFDGLDDPTPPAFGDDLLPGVLRRGQQLRHQRRVAYTVGSACAAVLIAGTGIGLAGGSDNHGTPAPPLSPAPTVSHTKAPHRPHHTKSPGTTVGGTQPGGQGSSGHQPPKTCESPTPPASPASPTPSPSESPADSVQPTPLLTETAAIDDEPTTSPTPTPAATECATPEATPTDTPMDSETPTPTYSLPPLFSARHPSSGITDGSS
jgi:hypothetical protein